MGLGLGGSWAVTSGVISLVIWIISILMPLITLLLTAITGNVQVMTVVIVVALELVGSRKCAFLGAVRCCVVSASSCQT